MDPMSFSAEVRAAIGACRARVTAFLESAPEQDFAREIETFDRMFEPLNGLAGRVGLYVSVHPDAAVRTACEELEQEISALHTETSLNHELFTRLAALAPGTGATPDERRVLEHGLRDFRRSGVDCDEPTRKRIRGLQEELVKIGQEFDRNIITGGKEYVVAGGHADLAGLPADFLEAHPQREDGTVVLSTDPEDRLPVLTYAENDDLRREYFLASVNRAAPENLEVLPRLLARRYELAGLLGFEHWADYITEDKMSGSAGEARAFVERVVGLVKSRAEAEIAELVEKKRAVHPEATGLEESERAFWTEKVRRTRFDFDSQSVRPYFGYERVKEGILATSARLYGVEFRRNHEVEVWHAAVECYDVLDQEQVVARFFLDMHSRADKYKHAAMFHLSEGASGATLPEAALVCNFPEPTADTPALMLHDQVVTYFHEFGHLLHHLFAGRQRFLSFCGISTEHDFVEVPSQMYEEWAWDIDVLATFARHVDTDEPISPDVVERMRAADEYGKGMHVLGQMLYALLSLTYYDRDPDGLDLTATMIELKQRLWPIPHTDGNNFHASFGHLHGYSAMYYTYMWSLVISKDLFSQFESDLMSGVTANRYRAEILAPGGSKDARDLVRSFLGREYAFDAFERWLGR